MKPEEFCYWLQGYFELSEEHASLTPKQLETIKNHLNLVFVHFIDPKASSHIADPQAAKQYQDGLNKIHSAGKPTLLKDEKTKQTSGLDPHVVYRC